MRLMTHLSGSADSLFLKTLIINIIKFQKAVADLSFVKFEHIYPTADSITHLTVLCSCKMLLPLSISSVS